jgi:hypothetical protein
MRAPKWASHRLRRQAGRDATSRPALTAAEGDHHIDQARDMGSGATGLLTRAFG